MKIEINQKIGRIALYQNLSLLFLNQPIPKEMIKGYLYSSENEEFVHEMVEFIAANLKYEVAFSTSFPIMDAIEEIMNANQNNENIEIFDDNV